MRPAERVGVPSATARRPATVLRNVGPLDPVRTGIAVLCGLTPLERALPGA
ncbi:hypothetical protein [Streptomyces sp. AM8-1-1]|uniref:hypothetical protein n=1 Tax=Streptomyces sp. AM8-1-1 TaxID=3075825 RepID=UPI0028C39F6C|nr:hypothetical protein [Streptomyces sp. AM8-1-1]WNO72994.1 hypothetical protein RPQ07_15700 [Streptomyces sp. AM8-1-1]